MKELKIGKNEDGKRMDAVLARLLPKAGKGFIYKMLRKKNIVLNDKKADGSERVSEGDVIRLYLSDETFDSFSEGQTPAVRNELSGTSGREKDFANLIIYEDDDIILINKPAGMLSQKAQADDVSANELLIGYLLDKDRITEEELKSFKPSVCNRLDRNTSGILCAGISLKGSRELTRLIRERLVDKYYACIVKGVIGNEANGFIRLRSFFSKDEKNNTARIADREFEGSVPVEIEYMPVRSENGYTLLKVKLITGKSHQIRAQLAHIGHPIAGDAKYGDRRGNDELRGKYGIRTQLLTAFSFGFPQETRLEGVKGRTFTTELPESFFIRGI